MNLAKLLEVSSDLSARGDLTGWFQLARSYLLTQQDTHIVEWTNQHLGWQGTPAGSAPRIHHLGLTFFSNSSDLSIADPESHASKCGFSEPRRFPSVLLMQTLVQHQTRGALQVDVFKAHVPQLGAPADASNRPQVEVLSIAVEEPQEPDSRQLLRASVGPLLHVAFDTSSPAIHSEYSGILLGAGCSKPGAGEAFNPHEGLYSSYFDTKHLNSPLRLELCYSLPKTPS